MSTVPVNTLHEIGRLIEAETRVDHALGLVLRAAREQLGASSASVFLRDRESDRGRRLTDEGAEPPRWIEGDEGVDPGGLNEAALHADAATAVEDAANDPLTAHGRGDRAVAVLAAPLRCDGEVLGVLYASFDRPRRFDARRRRVIEVLSGYAATAVRNARRLDAARLDAAIKTAQAAAHELSQPLAVVVGYAELIQDCTEPEDMRRYASLVNRAALDAAARLDKFRSIIRYVELQFGDLEPILDLDRSAASD